MRFYEVQDSKQGFRQDLGNWVCKKQNWVCKIFTANTAGCLKPLTVKDQDELYKNNCMAGSMSFWEMHTGDEKSICSNKVEKHANRVRLITRIQQMYCLPYVSSHIKMMHMSDPTCSLHVFGEVGITLGMLECRYNFALFNIIWCTLLRGHK